MGTRDENKRIASGEGNNFERKENKCQKPVRHRNNREMYSKSRHQKLFHNRQIDLDIADYFLNISVL